MLFKSSTVATPVMRLRAGLLAILGLALPPGAAMAQEVAAPPYFLIGATVEVTDNILRAPENPESGAVGGIVSDFQWGMQGSRIGGAVLGALEYYRYTVDTPRSEFLRNVLGNLDVQLVENHLDWIVQGSLWQGRVDLAQPEGPQNRQNIGIVTTGPHAEFLLGSPRTRLELDALYQRSEFSQSPNDTEGKIGRVSLTRQTSAAQTIAARVTVRRLDSVRDESTFAGYQSREATVEVRRTSPRGSITVEGGYVKVGEPYSLGSGLLRLDLRQRVGARGEVSLAARSETVGAAEAIRFDQARSGISVGNSDIATNPDPFKLRFVGVGYALGMARTRVTVDLSRERNTYEVTTASNREYTALRLGVSRQLTPLWQVGGFAERSREDYSERNLKFDNTRLVLSTSVQFARSNHLEFSVERFERLGRGAPDMSEHMARLLVFHGFGRVVPTSRAGAPRFSR